MTRRCRSDLLFPDILGVALADDLDGQVRANQGVAFADLIESHALELAVLGVRDNGTEINMAYKAEPMSAAGTRKASPLTASRTADVATRRARCTPSASMTKR